jgi:hypothetical protein
VVSWFDDQPAGAMNGAPTFPSDFALCALHFAIYFAFLPFKFLLASASTSFRLTPNP